MESPTKTSKREKDFTQANIRSIIYDRTIDDKYKSRKLSELITLIIDDSTIDDGNKKLKISKFIKYITHIHILQLLKDNYEIERDKPDQSKKELYDDITEMIDTRIIVLQSGGRRKTKRRHTKRRKSKARRKNL